MPDTTRKKLSQALEQIDRPGSFCVSGSLPAVLPGLEVKGLGPVGLPLTAKQAKELKKHCVQAPYGKGEKTLVDTSVRRVWRMEPDQFRLQNPEWEKFVRQTVRTVQEELGLEKQKLESHLYDLLLYEKGSFFLPHRDGEKLDRMVATLVMVLPGEYEGGELVVRHEGQEQTIDFRSGDSSAFHVHYAAFYADCEHEVRPLRKGHRLCLVYNLTLAKSKKRITAPREAGHIESISHILRQWSKADAAKKLVITLDHQYTPDGLAWDALKGVDRARARVLDQAARRADCRAYLALLTFHESGSAEYPDGGGYGYGGRWYGDEEEEAGEYEMGEVFDSDLSAAQIYDSAGKGLPIPGLSVAEEELLDPEALTEVDPEEEFEGYTGNAGMTLDRWYRHAAILIWPEKRHFRILCDRSSREAIPVLKELVKEWRQAGPKGTAVLKAQCTDLAVAILSRWSEDQYGYGYGLSRNEQPEVKDLVKALSALDDPRLIATFLGEVLVKDASVDPGEPIVAMCRKHGWSTFQRELTTVVRSTTFSSLVRNIRLLEHICTAEPGEKEDWGELCVVLAKELVQALEALDGEKGKGDWREREVKRAEVLAGLAQALLATEQFALLSRVVDHALATPNKYPLHTAHLRALESLRPWLKKHVKKHCIPLSRWVAWCLGQLESLTAEEPEEPRDFRRPAPITHKCADCGQLNRFLADPHESVFRLPAAQDRRSHLEHAIRSHKCDVDCKTDKHGRPYTLVCTKNTASFKERLKQYHQDQKHLAMVRAIAASLPARPKD